MRCLLTMVAVLATASPFCISQPLAQEQCKVSADVSASDTKYTKQYTIDVDDVPGHQIRVFELHRVFVDEKPNCEGLKRKEEWSRGMSDYINRNGRLTAYTVTVMDNNDKIFGERTGESQTTTDGNGSKKSVVHSVVRINGGTGKYSNVRGVIREVSEFDLDRGTNRSQQEGEYWFIH